MASSQLLIQLSGIPGTGKSTLAKALAARLDDARVIYKDDDTQVVQARSPELRGSELSEAAYARTFHRADVALSAGQTVIVDSPAYRPVVAENASALARRYGARLVLLELGCADRVTLQGRLDGRESRNYTANADLFEPSMVPDGASPAFIETSGRSSAEVVQNALGIVVAEAERDERPAVALFTGSGLGPLSLDQAAVTRLEALREAGTRLGLIADVPANRSVDYLFDVVVSSDESGLTLPDARLIKLALSRLHFAGRLDTVTFVDRAGVNVEAARALGMSGLVSARVPELSVSGRGGQERLC